MPGKMDLDVVLHVVLPSHDLATHGTPPLVPHLGHVGVRVYSCKTQWMDMWVPTNKRIACPDLGELTKRPDSTADLLNIQPNKQKARENTGWKALILYKTCREH